MRNLILALIAGAALCATGVAAEAMPVVARSAAPTTNIQKAAVVVRRTTVIRRPARRVCTTRIGALGRRVTVCR